VRAELTANIGGVVRVINALSPLLLEERGLAAALHTLAEEFSLRDQLRVEAGVTGNFGALPPQVELALFRVAQEAVGQVARQAAAGHCRVSLQVEGGQTVLMIDDDALAGRGDSALPPASYPA